LEVEVERQDVRPEPLEQRRKRLAGGCCVRRCGSPATGPLSSCVLDELRNNRLEAHWLAVCEWPDAGMAEDQEPELRAAVTKRCARCNAALSQELLVIRRNHKIGEVSLDPLRWV
jgi:hypothetical protein